jgi:LytS/YehU family sensor histidine kinase
MEAIGHYLSIQGRRYEEKLEVSAEVSERASSYPVPCFLIHPLVENAIKYGMQTTPMPLRIAIRADAHDGNLTLTVKNTGKWVESHTAHGAESVGTGTGMENVRQRLDAAFPGRHRLVIGEKDGWVMVELEIRAVPQSKGARG